MNKLNLSGKKFGRWKVLSENINNKLGSWWNCECECGTKRVVGGSVLKRGLTKSCGCLSNEIHRKILLEKWDKESGISSKERNHPLKKIYTSIKDRCTNSNNKNYHRYGGRGIELEWKDYTEFYLDMVTGYKKHIKEFGVKNTSLDRINNDGNYCKENCRWATRKEQANNMSNNLIVEYNNKKYTLPRLSELLDIPYSRLRYRIFLKKWPVEKAVSKKRFYPNKKYE